MRAKQETGSRNSVMQHDHVRMTGCFKRQSKKIFRCLIIVVFSCFYVSCSFCSIKCHKHTPSLTALTAGKGIDIYIYINIDVNK